MPVGASNRASCQELERDPAAILRGQRPNLPNPLPIQGPTPVGAGFSAPISTFLHEEFLMHPRCTPHCRHTATFVRQLVLLAVLSLAAIPGVALANAFDVYGFEPRGMGMAGAMGGAANIIKLIGFAGIAFGLFSLMHRNVLFGAGAGAAALSVLAMLFCCIIFHGGNVLLLV